MPIFSHVKIIVVVIKYTNYMIFTAVLSRSVCMPCCPPCSSHRLSTSLFEKDSYFEIYRICMVSAQCRSLCRLSSVRERKKQVKLAAASSIRAPRRLRRRLGLDGARHIGTGSVSGLKSLPCCLWAGTCSAGGGRYCFWVGESFRN